MVDFRIDVIVDPRKAKTGTAQVDRALRNTEKEALELKQAINGATTVKASSATAGLRQVDAALNKTEKEVNDVNDELRETQEEAGQTGSLLKRAFAGIGLVLLTKQFITMADSLTNVQNRLRLVTKDSAEMAAVQAELFAVSNATRSSFDGTAETFNRLSVSAGELGKTNSELIQFTKSLNQAIILSGASATEANAGLIQLSQGLAAGALRGDELNSVMEQLPAVANVISKSLGVTVGQLRKLGAEGKITADIVLTAFEEARAELEDRFATTVPTVGQSFTVLGNKILESVGALNEATGATILLSKAILFIGENIEIVAASVAILALAFSGGLLLAIPAATAAMGAFIVAAGPLLAVSAAGIAVAVAFKRITDEINAAGEVLRQLEEDAMAIPALGSQISAAQREINGLKRAIEATLGRDAEADVSNLTNRIAELEGRIVATKDAVKEKVVADEKAVTQALANKEAEIELNKATERRKALLSSLKRPQEEFNQLQKDLNVLLAEGKIKQEELNKALEAARPKEKKPEDVKDPFAEQVKSIRELNEELEIQANNQGLQEAGLLIELDLRRQGVTLTREQQDQLAANLITNRMLTEELAKQKKEEQDIAKAVKEQQKSRDDAAQRIEDIKATVDVMGQLKAATQELIDLRNHEKDVVIPGLDDAINELTLRQLDAARDIESGFTRAFARIAQEAEDLAAVGESVVNVFADRATDALVEFARTGQFSFKEFANAILDDLIRIIARLLIVQALSAIGGGVGGILGTAATNAGRQGGGTVQPGQAPFPVNEAGQELFVPNRTGTIVPAPVASEPPQVNVQLVTVQSEDMVAEAIANGGADDAIIQRIGANRDRVNSAQS